MTAPSWSLSCIDPGVPIELRSHGVAPVLGDRVNNILLIIRHVMPVFLTISLHKSFSRRLPCWCIHPFPRAPLQDLLPSVHPKVVPVFPQCPSQRIYWYY